MHIRPTILSQKQNAPGVADEFVCRPRERESGAPGDEFPDAPHDDVDVPLGEGPSHLHAEEADLQDRDSEEDR